MVSRCESPNIHFFRYLLPSANDIAHEHSPDDLPATNVQTGSGLLGWLARPRALNKYRLCASIVRTKKASAPTFFASLAVFTMAVIIPMYIEPCQVIFSYNYLRTHRIPLFFFSSFNWIWTCFGHILYGL